MKDIYAGTHLVGGMTADWWARDPKRMAFVAARYKFVARMFHGFERVLEVGCADGVFSRIVRQSVGHLTAIDIDARAINEAVTQDQGQWPVMFMVGDIQSGGYHGYDGVYALDVMEHMRPDGEDWDFLVLMRRSAKVAIIGAPSAESQPYASELSRAGHVNCMTEPGLREQLQQHWKQVFIFGMNDETLHTGFGPMCHYRLALCVA